MISEFSTSRSDPTRSDLIPRSIYLCSAQASPKPFTSPKVTLPSQAAVVPMRTGRPIRWAFEISRAQASPNWTQEPTSTSCLSGTKLGIRKLWFVETCWPRRPSRLQGIVCSLSLF